MMISPGVFFRLLGCYMVKGQKMAQDDKNILSGALHISGTINHMIVIYGTLV